MKYILHLKIMNLMIFATTYLIIESKFINNLNRYKNGSSCMSPTVLNYQSFSTDGNMFTKLSTHDFPLPPSLCLFMKQYILSSGYRWLINTSVTTKCNTYVGNVLSLLIKGEFIFCCNTGLTGKLWYLNDS